METKEMFEQILSEFKNTNQRLDRMENDITGIKSDVSELKTDIKSLKSDVSELKTDVAGLKSDVSELKTDVTGLKSDVVSISERLDNHRDMIFALIDGQATLGNKLDNVQNDINSIIGRTTKLEKISGGILYDIAVLKTDEDSK